MYCFQLGVDDNNDAIVFLNNCKTKFIAGMVIAREDKIRLVLGDDGRLERLVHNRYDDDGYWYVLGQLITPRTVAWMRDMMFRWYASFSSIFSLFHYPKTCHDLIVYLDRYQIKRIISLERLPKKLHAVERWDPSSLSFVSSSYHRGQQLIMFPNQWILYSIMGDNIYHPCVALFMPSLTQRVKETIYDSICKGKKSVILTTGSGLFRDWWWVSQLLIYYPWNEYYIRRRSPRLDPVDEALHCSSWGWDVECIE